MVIKTPPTRCPVEGSASVAEHGGQERSKLFIRLVQSFCDRTVVEEACVEGSIASSAAPVYGVDIGVRELRVDPDSLLEFGGELSVERIDFLARFPAEVDDHDLFAGNLGKLAQVSQGVEVVDVACHDRELEFGETLTNAQAESFILLFFCEAPVHTTVTDDSVCTSRDANDRDHERTVAYGFGVDVSFGEVGRVEEIEERAQGARGSQHGFEPDLRFVDEVFTEGTLEGCPVLDATEVEAMFSVRVVAQE